MERVTEVPRRSSKLDPKDHHYPTSLIHLPEWPPLPPKLEHSLDTNRMHNLVRAGQRDEGDSLEVPQVQGAGRGALKKASALKGKFPDGYDDGRATIVNIGGTPKDVEETKLIRSDYGNLASRFQYLGFGLWENTDPSAVVRCSLEPKAGRKTKLQPLSIQIDPEPPTKRVAVTVPPPPPPPPPPPRQTVPLRERPNHRPEEEPTLPRPQTQNDEIDGLSQYNVNLQHCQEVICIASTQSTRSPCQDLHEPLEKEDMASMFRRPVLEKMTKEPEMRLKVYNCSVCHQSIKGRLITAKSRKFHPECFVCTYCRKEFKDRTFKADSDSNPYCLLCFEKLLGHFGQAQGSLTPNHR